MTVVAYPNTDGEFSEVVQAVKKFNKQYAVVNENGKTMVYERVWDEMMQRRRIVRYEFADIKKLYHNDIISVRPATGKSFITKSKAAWWLGHPSRRTYIDSVTFDPTGRAPDTYWNLWDGYSVEPTPGDWGLMQEHVHSVICAGSTYDYEYFMNWNARMFQFPALPGEVALVVRGPKGSGKGLYFNYTNKAWGVHGIAIRNSQHLTGNFNKHLRDCVFLYADEAFFADDPKGEQVLKGLITEPTIEIEAKGQDLITVKNMLHIAMSSNLEWVVPASYDERRYAVLEASGHRAGQRAYFKAIAEQMENGGLAAMIHDLLHRDISGFEVRDVPNTAALAEQKRLSMDTLDRWWCEVLERGFVWKSRYGLAVFNTWDEFCSTELLHASYRQWCQEARIQRPMLREQLGKRLNQIGYEPQRTRAPVILREVDHLYSGSLKELGNADDGVVWSDPGGRPPGYTLGSLEQARSQFSAKRGTALDQ